MALTEQRILKAVTVKPTQGASCGIYGEGALVLAVRIVQR